MCMCVCVYCYICFKKYQTVATNKWESVDFTTRKTLGLAPSYGGCNYFCEFEVLGQGKCLILVLVVGFFTERTKADC